MNKREILTEIFAVEGIFDRIKKCPLINEKILLDTLSKDKYNLKQELGISYTTLSRYLLVLFPDRPSSTARVCNYLLSKYQYKHCKRCNLVKETDLFYKNKSYNDGLSSYCKICSSELEKPSAASRVAKYRAAKLQRTPAWLDSKELDLINDFYMNCPNGYQVDHIIPLQGLTVSGLHVLNNLQYLSVSENASKKNKYSPFS
jgi:hypothetical protein